MWWRSNVHQNNTTRNKEEFKTTKMITEFEGDRFAQTRMCLSAHTMKMVINHT